MPCNKEKREVSRETLKRLPRDFSWQLLTRLSELFCHESLVVSGELRTVLRKRDAKEYHRLRRLHGLQSIARDGCVSPYKQAITRLLVETASKSTELETVPAAARKKLAIRGFLDGDKFRSIELDRTLQLARDQIARLLPPLEMDQLYQVSRHGPGKTVLPFVGTSSYFKYAAWPYSVTPNAKPMLCDMIRADERWRGALEASYRIASGTDPWKILPPDWIEQDCVKTVPYNRIVTVPKDGTKDRVIAIEPMGNVMLQLGVDRIFRKALLKWGIDLNSQERNRLMAREGSERQGLLDPVTLDLSSASDRVSRELCEKLLPSDWFNLLDSLRSPYGLLPDGTGWVYHRMSSMGNGSTFVLETLIFASIIRAIAIAFGQPADVNSVCVYGDDCVYPRYLDMHVRAYFEYVGFIVNVDKSFSQGPVRESCGEDYYYGHNIRPVYLPPRIESADSLLAYRNGLVLWFRRCLGVYPPSSLLDWLDSYLGCNVGDGPTLEEHRSRYRFANVNARPVYRVRVLRLKSKLISVRDLPFRKLMHNLESCDSDGGSRFDITDRHKGQLVVDWGVVYAYQAKDYLQSSVLPVYP